MHALKHEINKYNVFVNYDPPACPTHTQIKLPTCTSGDPDCQLKKNTGYIQNMFHCLNIKNLQKNYLMIFLYFFSNWVGRDPNWKIPIRFNF